jgi:hypothetical protein
MAARKPKPVEIVEPETVEVANLFDGEEGVCVSKSDLEAALRANMMFKLGAAPVVGQFDDLWRRLREA